MTYKKIRIRNTEINFIDLHTAVVGSGAAGYNAALRLLKNGIRDIAIITEDKNCGTSRNTGSDKQTYYKMNLCGDCPDSPALMAKDLFDGKCVDGDIALAEASLSVKCFLNLAELGVPFPTNRYGEYVGYKTDHDPKTRATSAGPLTSKMMTECLESAAEKENVLILDRLLAVAVIKDENRALGLLCLDKSQNCRFVAIKCENIIWATGGPAGIYNNTVYPIGHTGSNGVAFEAGVKGRNLTEWQYGLASVSPRWNVSGTYMQVLPRFVSVDKNGNEHEFLSEYFSDIGECLTKIFHKGYEWPFDCKKAKDGSSAIDLLVYRESVLKNRKVYLDFTRNPLCLKELPFDKADAQTMYYLKTAEACFGTPIERLEHMNLPAYELYKNKGVDLETERLEISLCAQHNNGGLDVDMWWQTNLPHFFAAGEAAGSHGIYRPGGSALNAGQVGSFRAAQFIGERYKEITVSDEEFFKALGNTLEEHLDLCNNVLKNSDNVNEVLLSVTKKMDEVGGAVRDEKKIHGLILKNRELLNNFSRLVGADSARDLPTVYKLRDILISQLTYLFAMYDYAKQGGNSRGSAVFCVEDKGVSKNSGQLVEFVLDKGEKDGLIQTVSFNGGDPKSEWREVRPIPSGGGFFENVWRRYRTDKNTY